jgi:hypothetical protein
MMPPKGKPKILKSLMLAAAMLVAAGGADAVPPNPPVLQAPADSHTAAAMALLNITMSDATVAGMVEPMVAMFGAGADAKKTAELRKVFREEMMKAMPAYRQALAPFFVQTFSEKELRDITAYMGAPIYGKYQAQMPAIMADTMPRFMKLMQSVMVQAMASGQQAAGKKTIPAIPVIPLPARMDSHMAAAMDLSGYMISQGMQGAQMQKMMSGGPVTGPDGKPQQMPPGFAAMMRTMMADYKVIMGESFDAHFSEADLHALKAFFSAPIYSNYTRRLADAMQKAGPKASAQLMQATFAAASKGLQRVQQEQGKH